MNNQTQSIIVYRNPYEQMIWESHIPAIIGMSFIITFFVGILIDYVSRFIFQFLRNRSYRARESLRGNIVGWSCVISFLASCIYLVKIGF